MFLNKITNEEDRQTLFTAMLYLFLIGNDSEKLLEDETEILMQNFIKLKLSRSEDFDDFVDNATDDLYEIIDKVDEVAEEKDKLRDELLYKNSFKEFCKTFSKQQINTKKMIILELSILASNSSNDIVLSKIVIYLACCLNLDEMSISDINRYVILLNDTVNEIEKSLAI